MKKSSRIALGGIMTALSVVVMMLTGVIPMAEFALPAIAGLFLVPIVVEISWGTAWLSYGAVSLLSLLVAPNKECALYYILFLGCYPLIKSLLERCRKRSLEWVLKLLVFNVLAGAIVFSAAWLFRFAGYQELLQEAPWILAAGWVAWVAAVVDWGWVATTAMSSLPMVPAGISTLTVSWTAACSA